MIANLFLPDKEDSINQISQDGARAKLYTHAPNLSIRKRDSQNFLVQKEANQSWGLELLKFMSRNGSENRSKLIS